MNQESMTIILAELLKDGNDDSFALQIFTTDSRRFEVDTDAIELKTTYIECKTYDGMLYIPYTSITAITV